MLLCTRSDNIEHIFKVVLQEKHQHFLMLQEAVLLQGACNNNESTIAKRKDATI
jgi:hypothetical protein